MLQELRLYKVELLYSKVFPLIKKKKKKKLSHIIPSS